MNKKLLLYALIVSCSLKCIPQDISIELLPPERWQEYKKIRLEMLLEQPNAYGATYEEESLLPDTQWQNYLSEATAEKRTILRFCLVNNTVVGMAGVKMGTSTKTCHSAQLFSVYLKPELRGHGVAKKLIENLLNQTKSILHLKKIGLTVNVQQKAAINLYVSLGFAVEGKILHHWQQNNKAEDVYIMGLSLKNSEQNNNIDSP